MESFVPAAFLFPSSFSLFTVCDFKPRQGAGVPKGVKDTHCSPFLPPGHSTGISPHCHIEAHVKTGTFQKGKLLSGKDALDQLFCAIFCLPAGALLKLQRTGTPALFRQDFTGVKPSQDLSPGTD